MAKRKKKIRAPKGITPRRIDEKAYYKSIKTEILDPLLSKTMQRLEEVPKIKAAYAQAVNNEFLLATQGDEFGVEVAEKALNNIRHVHRVKMIQSFQAALGVDINPFMSDLNIRHIMNQALMDNVALIKSIPRELNLQIVSEFDNIFQTKGFDQEALIESLEGRFNVANNRARFIARDQTEKIVSNLNEARQTDLGITSYRWQTSEDERVVGNPAGLYPNGSPGHMDHFSRNGQIFLWAVPPPDGHPGQAFNCRCTAIPVIPELEMQEAS